MPESSTRVEIIREWVEREFNAKYHDCVTQDLVDVATGNRDGNRFENEALERIFAEEELQGDCPHCGRPLDAKIDPYV